jgi:co-chaperonin GroES (HSP10)
MKFIPLGQRVLVEDIFERYEGILQLPPTSKEKPTFTGRVAAISEEIVKPHIKIDDIIFLGQLIYQSRAMNIADVLGIWEK